MRTSRATSSLLAFVITAWGCAPDWPAFRRNALRTASQTCSSELSDPAKVPSLSVRWSFSAPGGEGFRASPVVSGGRVFIGNGNGRFYALDAGTGAVLWQYPPASSPALTSQYLCNPSSTGIASTAVVTSAGGKTAVVFGAPDQSIGTGLGEGRLFALDAESGAELWKSPPLARLTGLTSGSKNEFHEQIGYSSPVVFGERIYVGIGDHCDNPIQKGRVVAVERETGAIDSSFSYCSTGTCGDSTRGGGVWSPIGAWNGGIYITTGNTKSGAPTEPSPNHGLSLIRLDATSGTVLWKFQPVPWQLDGDPDWSASPTVMNASCGTIAISTMKDGWTHALDAMTGAHRWSFPPAALPFSSGDGTVHGDTRYMRGGAVWGDVYVTMNGGLNLTASVTSGYKRLHAFNVCAAASDRLRWLIDVPGASGATYSLGNPTVTRGIFYVGTDTGRLVAIADPSLYPAAGWRCSNPDVTSASCVASGYTLVPEPAVLANVSLSGRIVYTEPALADGRAYVSTDAGNLYMLSP